MMDFTTSCSNRVLPQLALSRVYSAVMTYLAPHSGYMAQDAHLQSLLALGQAPASVHQAQSLPEIADRDLIPALGVALHTLLSEHGLLQHAVALESSKELFRRAVSAPDLTAVVAWTWLHRLRPVSYW